MNKTKIDWADSTWNPVTGCYHGCKYCYARKIAERFEGGGYGKQDGMFISKYQENAFPAPHVLEDPQLMKTKNEWYSKAPYPFGFEPTFHRYRLGEPAQKTKPQNIFVCSMADLFGEWVPDEWITDVLKACEAAPQHRYLFLTKNPQRYNELLLPEGDNYWWGGTRTMKDSDREHEAALIGKTFLSIEPLLAELEPGLLHALDCWDWIIVGVETGNCKDKVIPKREWIERIAIKCKTSGTPLFMKTSLKELMCDDFIQQYPWEV